MTRSDLVRTAHALSRHGLVTAFGHVSERTGTGFRITPAGDLAEAHVEDLIDIPLGARTLPSGAPPEAWAHMVIYEARPCVDAVVRGMPPSAFAVAACTDALPPLHGQGAWLGDVVPVHDDARLLRSRELAESAIRSLAGQDALILRGNGAVAVGSTPAIGLARLWLVEAAASAWLRARAAGEVRTLTVEEVASWQRASGPLISRLGQHLLDAIHLARP